jgi:hypothetical protein
MAIAEYDYADFENGKQAEQDAKLLVKFFYKTKKDTTKSAEQGRPVFKDVEYVDISVPGNRGSGVKRPATFRDKQRFPRHYAAFKQRIELPQEGTPLSEWPVISRSMAEELSFHGVKTVEHMAEMSDTIASSFMGGQSYKAKANEWLERARKDVTESHLASELYKRDKLIATMQEQLDKLTSEHKPKRKRRTPEEIERDNKLSDSGQRFVEQSGSGSGADTGS